MGKRLNKPVGNSKTVGKSISVGKKTNSLSSNMEIENDYIKINYLNDYAKIRWVIEYEYKGKKEKIIDYFPVNFSEAEARRYIEKN